MIRDSLSMGGSHFYYNESIFIIFWSHGVNYRMLETYERYTDNNDDKNILLNLILLAGLYEYFFYSLVYKMIAHANVHNLFCRGI